MPGRDTPFVGRQRELAVLLEHLAAAGRGEGSVVLIAGEPGIGKTRLLAELAEQARVHGWRVLLGRAYETAGMPPYLPFIEALREHVRGSSIDELTAQIGDGAAAVALLIPEIRRRLPELPTAASLPPDQQRYVLFESISDFLLAIAAPRRVGGGLLLILDDVHWADRPALLLLQHLARRLAGASVLVACAYRTADLDRTPQLADLLVDLRRQGYPERLLLPPLASEEITALIQETIGAKPAPAVVNAIARETDGNPLFVGEIIRHLLAEGHDLIDPAQALGRWDIPEGVRDLIAQRLSRLSEAARQMLRLGAVLGDGFTIDLVKEAGSLDESGLLDALDEAVAAGIVREEDSGYRWTHPLLRRTLYDTLSLPRRQRLHRHAAQAIERVHAHDLERHTAALAAHYRLATPADAERAIEYSLRAGQSAQVVFAWEEAESHWQAALELMEASGADPSRRGEMLLELATLMYTLGFDHYARCIAYLEKAQALYEALNDEDRLAETWVRLGNVLASNAAEMDIPRALALFRSARPVLEKRPESMDLAILYGASSSAAMWGSRRRKASRSLGWRSRSASGSGIKRCGSLAPPSTAITSQRVVG